MKKMFLFFAVVLPGAAATAQDCSGYYYLQQNKVITMTVFDRKEKVSGTYVYRVSDVKQNGATVSSMVNGEMTDEKGKLVSRTSCQMKCSGGMYQVDMKMLLPQQQQEQFKNMDVQSGFYLEYPGTMKAGEQLKDGSFTSVMKNDNGLEVTLEMNITDRLVIAEEDVTTPAGTWKCFKISFRSKVRTKVGGIGIPFQIENTEWFAPAFGVVKTSSKWGGTEITNIQ